MSENPTLFDLLHEMDKVNAKMILRWKKLFQVNIGISHILVLSYLKENGPSRPSDIAKYLEFAPASLTHLSDKLIDNHFCVRKADSEDRRISYLAITQSGLDVLEQATILGQEMKKEYFKVLTDDEIAQLLIIYTKLNTQ
ncbi:MarR family winged helix-turn-helix transcriptional regulator [Rummeliibacillus pycnus]|uniref:MarR family winged helix-turn-helix transcriptional regulator n=1 Tax=Rummeliibacillus pycnus TaxID=101070 RepID=UPI000C9A3199|nr:MarR family transcriptional regulator [Rummeliibacillus pycnus]